MIKLFIAKTPEEKAKDKKAYKVIQTLRGVLQPRKAQKSAEQAHTLINENVSAMGSMKQKNGGR